MSSNHRHQADYSQPHASARCMICGKPTCAPVFIASAGGVCCSHDCLMEHGRNLNLDLLNVRIDLKQRKNA